MLILFQSNGNKLPTDSNSILNISNSPLLSSIMSTMRDKNVFFKNMEKYHKDQFLTHFVVSFTSFSAVNTSTVEFYFKN